MVATEAGLRDALFGARPYAEVILANLDGKAVGFALFCHNFSTFVGKPGIYLEDLFVDLQNIAAKKSINRARRMYMIRLAKEHNCGRVKWSVLELEHASHRNSTNPLGAGADGSGGCIALTEEDVIENV